LVDAMNLFSRILAWFAPPPPPDSGTQAGLQRIGDLVDKALSLSPGFHKRLVEPVEHARRYCASLVAALPPATDIDRQSFASNPLIHALFASADDIDNMLAASASVRAFLASPQSLHNDHFFALMAARRKDKQVLGVALQGDIVTTGVAQALLQFSNQVLILPASDPDAARTALLAAAFDGLLRTFTEHVEEAQATYTSLRAERELERIRERAAAANAKNPAVFPSRHIATLDERLHHQFESLQPEALMTELIRFLTQPEDALSLSPVQMRVTRGGVIQANSTETPDTNAELINFTELHSRDRRRHIVLPVRIRCDEARAALERTREAREHENMLLI
jgi:hypothetical protein